MARKNFFEMMEREINFQDEYEKIEDIILNRKVRAGTSLDDLIEQQFTNWKYRRNFATFWELRYQMAFTYSEASYDVTKYTPDRKSIKLEDFLLYAEMILNMMELLLSYDSMFVKSAIDLVIGIIVYDLEKINHEVIDTGEQQYIIVQKDAAATAVADIVKPDLAHAIIEYNHHLLKGDLIAKKEILRKMADALEPKRDELKAANRKLESDFFMLVNNMNIRHNNCDLSDPKKYVESFAKLTKKQKETWYDDIYQEGLMAFLTLEQVKRNQRVDAFKDSMA